MNVPSHVLEFEINQLRHNLKRSNLRIKDLDERVRKLEGIVNDLERQSKSKEEGGSSY